MEWPFAALCKLETYFQVQCKKYIVPPNQHPKSLLLKNRFGNEQKHQSLTDDKKAPGNRSYKFCAENGVGLFFIFAGRKCTARIIPSLPKYVVGVAVPTKSTHTAWPLFCVSLDLKTIVMCISWPQGKQKRRLLGTQKKETYLLSDFCSTLEYELVDVFANMQNKVFFPWHSNYLNWYILNRLKNGQTTF